MHTTFRISCHIHYAAVARGHLVCCALGRSRSRESASGKARNGFRARNASAGISHADRSRAQAHASPIRSVHRSLALASVLRTEGRCVHLIKTVIIVVSQITQPVTYSWVQNCHTEPHQNQS